MQHLFIFSICAEEDKCLLSRLLLLFTRRNIAIQSLIAHKSEVDGLYYYSVVASTEVKCAEQICKELNKIIGVAQASYLVKQEAAKQSTLYKIRRHDMSDATLVEIMEMHDVKLLATDAENFVLEKAGNPLHMQDLLQALQPYGVQEYSLSKTMAVA